MRLLILDNYDSFTYNLVHLVEKISDIPFDVALNDTINLDAVNLYSKILLSPGPGLPSNAGIMPDLVQRYHKTKSILGVCLGLQAIGEAFGCGLKNTGTVFHGLATPVHHFANDPLFNDCPTTFNAGRYHSWSVDRQTISEELVITAMDDHNLVMGLRHKTYNVRGVQFHPESILSEHGDILLKNWLLL